MPERLVTFQSDSRAFGIDVSAVREIRGWQQTTPLPNSAEHVLGVINLRGSIVPVVDLRRRLGLGPTELSRSSVVIVTDIGDRLIGVLADAVSDIVDIQETDLQAAPAIQGNGDELVKTLAVKGPSVVALLELPAILNS
ncbi:chemotaxis protein CheW [uncultured Alsobacter sp.]|jgi:purine-binding chemotaxis protein CheW|uniref:chemotaxis protein CheW n=1 Tax=uncultured Alsobacter sp. TaxID=1748258 RepID=UPI0025E80F7A|nr:chemotaxis protein CheW [uncultured Alsobacter sp.]